ncbi:MAG: hypothetical protein ABW091_16760, partial [Microbacterium sp.]
MIAIIASLAIAGGFGALVGILIAGGRRQVAVAAGDVMQPPPAPRSAGASLRARAPKGYLAMFDRHLALAGRPPAWTIDRILIAKPILAAAGALLSLLWISWDPGPIRFAGGLALTTL